MNSAPIRRYSFTWSQSIVDKCYKNWGRAANLLEWAFGITSKDLVLYLAKGDELFPKFREVAHILRNWLEQQPNLEFNHIHVECLRDIIKRKGWERMARRLDDRLKNGIFKEQSSRDGAGSGGVAEADGPEPLLLHPLDWRSDEEIRDRQLLLEEMMDGATY